MNSGGSSAAKQGRILENTIVPTFSSHGFEAILYSQWIKNKNQFGQELLLKHVPYITIYGHPGYTEFLLLSKKFDLKVRIECKWQQSSGSVDEKFPYLYLNCVEAMPENDIIIVIGGGGYKPGALRWLKEAVSHRKYASGGVSKNITILSLDEFIRWANITLR